MRIISDILNREFDSVEACLAAEAAFEAREDEKASKIAELNEARKAYEEAEEHYWNLLNEFDKLYGSDEDDDEWLLEDADEYACKCKSPDCNCDKEIEAPDSLVSAIGKLLGGIEQIPKVKVEHPAAKTKDNSEIAISIEELLDAIFG